MRGTQTAPPYRRTLQAALTAYAVMIALVLGWPTPTTPVIGTLEVLSRWLRELGAPSWVSSTALEFVANIALFVPFGLLAALVLRGRAWWLPLLGGFGFSLVAEIVQGTFYPHRTGTVSDVIANTTGTAVGMGIAWMLTRRRSGVERGASAERQRRPSAR